MDPGRRLQRNDDFADDALSRSGQGDYWRISIDEIIDLVSDAYSISPVDLERPGKDRKFSEARRVNRNISSLSHVVSRLLKWQESKKVLTEKMKLVRYRLKCP